MIAIVIAGIVFLTFPRAEERNFRELLTENAELELLNAFCPVIAAAGDNGRLFVSGWIFPFLGYQSKTKTAQLAQENSDMVEKILLAEGRDEYTGMSGDDTEKNAPTDGRNLSLEELARLENEQAGGQKSGQNGVADGSETDESSAASDREGQSSGGIGTRPGDSQNETGDTANSSGIGDFTASLPEKQRTYNWSELTSYDALVREFYAIDPATGGRDAAESKGAAWQGAFRTEADGRPAADFDLSYPFTGSLYRFDSGKRADRNYGRRGGAGGNSSQTVWL